MTDDDHDEADARLDRALWLWLKQYAWPTAAALFALGMAGAYLISEWLS